MKKTNVFTCTINQTIDGLGKISAWKKWLYYTIGVFIFWFWYQSTMNILYAGELFPYEDFKEACRVFALNFPMILVMFLGNTAIVFALPWRRSQMIRIPIDFCLSTATIPLLVNGSFLIISWCLEKTARILWMQSYVLNLMIYLINEIVWFVANYQRFRRIATELEYNVLRAQVNPHFLFNSLNILYSLTYLDIDKSRDFVLSLSKMYRYIMTRCDSHSVTLRDEMEFLEAYTEVLKIINYNSFEVEIIRKENAPDENAVRVIPYSLQLLIENVTKHNVINSDNPMKVTVEIKRDGLVVSNPLRPRHEYGGQAQPTGVGINYLTKLYSMYGKSFRVESSNGEFTVEVPFIDSDI